MMNFACKPQNRLALALLTLGLLAPMSVRAQEDPVNIGLVGRYDQANNYADIWGEGNFAYLARFGVNEIDIVDISNPGAPALAATYDSGVGGASAQDVKVQNGLMYVGLENTNPGAQIVDVRDPFMPVKLTDITVRTAVHNVFIDNGWLYLVDSQLNQVDLVDLRGYDPDNAPTVISQATYRLFNVGNQFVHDITIQDGRMYASAWDSIRVYDVSNLDAGPPTLMGSAPGNAVHAAWPTADSRFLVVSEERAGGGLALYELDDNGSTVNLTLRQTLVLAASRAFSTHNPVVAGNTVYAAWYEAGLQVLEIDPDTATWAIVASYDTSAITGENGFFDGNWGVYPFLGPDRILASDVQNGLFVLDVDPQLLAFTFPNGQPATITPDTPTAISVAISEVGAPLDAATVALNPFIDGVAQTPVPMTTAGAVFAADLPGAPCGSVLEYFVTAQNTDGTVFREPATGAFRADVVSEVITVLDDTFISDLGWVPTATNLDTGAWVRARPNGTGAQPEGDWPGDADDQCYFTGQGPVGGNVGDADVDGGPAVLTSPALDFSAGTGRIRYVYWFSNDDGDDSLIVELSANGGLWIEAKRYTGGAGGWVSDSVPVDNAFAPSADVRVRFVTSDSPNDSITEAAIDSVSADVFGCAAPTDSDGDGIPDASDNCTLVANVNQTDSNGDGFGNACDADLNNDNVINVVDLGLLRAVFFTDEPDADFNGDGVVNVVDLGLMRQSFFGPPGPSGVAP